MVQMLTTQTNKETHRKCSQHNQIHCVCSAFLEHLQRVRCQIDESVFLICRCFFLEIDRYSGLPIFFPIFKHFIIIGYRFWKKMITDIVFFIFFIFFYIHNYTEFNQQLNVFSVFNSSKYTHTWSSGHTHTPGAVDTVHSGNAPARPPHVTFNKIHLFETR